MAYEHTKSGTTIFLDIIRNLLILAATCYVVFLIWKWNWIIALIAAVPVYVIWLNLFGFLTLPLYTVTPENRLKAKTFKAFQKGDFEQGKTLTDKFTKKFNVNMPEQSPTSIQSAPHEEGGQDALFLEWLFFSHVSSLVRLRPFEARVFYGELSR